MDTAIDWLRLGRAFEAFKDLGYAPVNVPWIVSKEVQMLTCPDERNIMRIPDHGGLVGSAEQGFIAMSLAGSLPPGRFVALTPCFRDELVDATHTKHFMKVELYAWGEGRDLRSDMTRMIEDARSVMEDLSGVRPISVPADCGWDLEIAGIEVGSYGVREAGGIAWAFGTGLAEPRFSHAVDKTA